MNERVWNCFTKMGILAATLLVLLVFLFLEVTPAYAENVTEVQSVRELEAAIENAGQPGAAGGPVTIQLQKGTYSTEKPISVYNGDITVDLNGNTVSTTGSYAFSISADKVNIKNGTLKGGGIDVTGDDGNGEISGVKITSPGSSGIHIRDCVIGEISNNTISSPNESHICILNGGKVKGAISGNTLTGGKEHGISLHNGGSAGSIINNKISGVKYRGILLHSSSTGDISGNTLTNIGSHGISMYSGSKAKKIHGNTLKVIGGKDIEGIGDYAITANESSVECITDNYVEAAGYASIVAYKPRGIVAGDISGNTVVDSGTCKKHVKDWSKIKGKLECQGAIYVSAGAEVKGDIHDNVVRNSYDDGINICKGSKAHNIYNNKITKVANAGIAAKSGSKVLNDIYGNTIVSAKLYGLFTQSQGAQFCGNVYNNTITDPKRNGIFIGQSSSANIIRNNTVTNAGLYAVTAAGGGKINKLLNNKLSLNNVKEGIVVLSNTNCCITKIQNNKISGKYSCGIRVKSPTKKMLVSGNVLTTKTPKNKRCVGISIEGCKNKTIKVLKNKITGNKTAPGIQIKTSKGKIKGNKIKKAKRKIAITKGKYKVIK